jgi:hypothetical protein
MIGVLGGFPAVYVVWFGSDAVLPPNLRNWLHNVSGCRWDDLIPAFSNLNRYPFWQGFAILFGLAWVCILLATLMTRPEPLDTLQQRFYLAAGPIGFRGPVRHSLGGEAMESRAAETVRDLFVCCPGIVFYFSLTVALFSLMGGHRERGALSIILATTSGYVFAGMAMSRLDLSADPAKVVLKEG